MPRSPRLAVLAQRKSCFAVRLAPRGPCSRPTTEADYRYPVYAEPRLLLRTASGTVPPLRPARSLQGQYPFQPTGRSTHPTHLRRPFLSVSAADSHDTHEQQGPVPAPASEDNLFTSGEVFFRGVDFSRMYEKGCAVNSEARSLSPDWGGGG